jgi:translation initiation factor 5A
VSKPVDVGSLRVGGYMIVDDQACRIVGITKSKPGKHGAAKARIVAIGVFDGVKRSLVKPVDANAPLIQMEFKSWTWKRTSMSMLLFRKKKI